MSLRSFKSLWQIFGAQRKNLPHLQKTTQAFEEALNNYFKRLVSAVNKAVSDSDTRQVLIKTLVFEFANTECKKVTISLKAQSVLWISG